MPILSTKEKRILFDQIKQYTSLTVVTQFLKNLELPYSAGNWPDMFEKRLEPAVKDSKISKIQLLQLLADAEEFGRQNVFLFRCSKNDASGLVNEPVITGALKSLGREDWLSSPPIIEEPGNLTIAQVRFEHGPTSQRSLVIKAVETRTYWEKIEETRQGKKMFKEYDEQSQRAVTVARLHSDGLLEMRIQSFERAGDYDTAISQFWSVLNPLMPKAKFETESVHKFKNYLIKNRASLSSRIRYAPLLLRSETGYTMALGTPDLQHSLFKDKGATEGFEAFNRNDANVENGSFIWMKMANGKPSKDTHIRIAGKVNQFAVAVSCERADYEFIFDEIRKNNA